MENKLRKLGFNENEILSIITTLTNARKKFMQRGFLKSQENINEYFLNQYEIFKNKGVLNPRKEAMSMIYKAKFSPIKKSEKIGRNSLCPCGSGKKYKKCCL
jgi:preprotein translocase subunit SecA